VKGPAEDLFPAIVRSCPGLLPAKGVTRGANPKEKPHCRFNRFVEWIKNHKFTKARKESWFDVLVYQARLYARHARVANYWHDWEVQWGKHHAPQYPAFKGWSNAADRYIFKRDKT